MTPRLYTFASILLAASLVACSGDKGIDEGDDGGSDGGSTSGDGGSGSGDGGSTTSGDDVGGQTFEDATPLEALDVGYWEVEESIGEAGDRDFFSITLAEGAAIGVGTLAYAIDGEAEPDTVLRLYSPQGELLATNDDMPFRIQETDSALYFQAQEDGDYVIEVLEWSDWDEDYDAVGGADFDYVLVAFELTQLDPEPDNDDFGSLDTYVATNGGTFYGSAWATDTSLPYEIHADMDSSTDLDLYSIGFDEAEDGSYDSVYCSFSTWPSWYADLEPRFTLYDDTGAIVGQQDDPMYGLDRYYEYGGFTYDVGIMYRMPTGRDYYLGVTDQNGASGLGTYYAGLIDCFIVNEDVVQVENDDIDSNDPSNGPTMVLSESSSSAGYYYGWFVGEIDALNGDTLDAIRIGSGDLGGNTKGLTMTLNLSARLYGSLLDPQVTVYGDGEVIHTATGNDFDDASEDPVFTLALEGDYSTIDIAIEAEDFGAAEGSNSYFGFISFE